MMRQAALRFLAFAVVPQSRHVGAVKATPEDYLIHSLPGLKEELNFRQYAGYMPLGDAGGTEMFFWFVEAENDPAEAPVAFWTNGGPGSSSIEYGFFEEHGPFRLERQSDGSINPVRYPYSWNRLANMLYLEMPTGVGFSFSKNESYYEGITDNQSCEESYLFLQQFFEVFHTFKANPFYLTGESFGGHYVPNLALRLLERPLGLDMRGLLIGNPGIESDWYYNVDEYAFVTYMWSHGLIPAPEYLRAHTVCGWENFYDQCYGNFSHPSAECQEATNAAIQLLPKPLDMYNILAPTCQAHQKRMKSAASTVPFVEHLKKNYGVDLGYQPCMAKLTAEYVNRPDVREAIHAHKELPQAWPDNPANWHYDQGAVGSKKNIRIEVFPHFFEHPAADHWKIWVVSGDADAAVPVLGTERWMGCLKRPVVESWTPWFIDGDVAGMVRKWDRMSLVTVKGCGHMIPMYCPVAGFEFFKNYLAGEAPKKREDLLFA